METENANPTPVDATRYAPTRSATTALSVEGDPTRRPKKNFSLHDPETLRRLRMTVARVCPRWLEREQEDLTQRAMLRLLERARRVEVPGELCASYLYRTAHNIVIDEIRKRRREVLSEDLGDQSEESVNAAASGEFLPSNPEGHVRDQNLRHALRECMAKLLQPRRLAFSMRMQGHSTKEIAQMLGWDSKKVENNIGRGRKNLQECLLNKGYGVA